MTSTSVLPRGGALWASLAVVVLAVALPSLIGRGYYLHLFTVAFVHVILSMGLNIVLGLTGLLALAHAGLFGVGAYTSALLVMKGGLSFWLALPAAALLTAVIGAAIGFSSLRLRGHYLAIATAGFGIIIYQVFLNWTSMTKGAAALSDIPVPNPILGIGFDSRVPMYFLILAFTVVSVWAFWRIKVSRIGKAFVAIREDEIAAEGTGIDTFRYKVIAFTLSAFYAGVAGSLYAHYVRIIAPETFHLFETVTSLLMVVSGGLGTIGGVVVTSVFFTIAPEVLRELKDYRMVAYGALLVVTIIFLPRGLSGAMQRLARRVRGGAPARQSRAAA